MTLLDKIFFYCTHQLITFSGTWLIFIYFQSASDKVRCFQMLFFLEKEFYSFLPVSRCSVTQQRQKRLNCCVKPGDTEICQIQLNIHFCYMDDLSLNWIVCFSLFAWFICYCCLVVVLSLSLWFCFMPRCQQPVALGFWVSLPSMSVRPSVLMNMKRSLCSLTRGWTDSILLVIGQRLRSLLA